MDTSEIIKIKKQKNSKAIISIIFSLLMLTLISLLLISLSKAQDKIINAFNQSNISLNSYNNIRDIQHLPLSYHKFDLFINEIQKNDNLFSLSILTNIPPLINNSYSGKNEEAFLIANSFLNATDKDNFSNYYLDNKRNIYSDENIDLLRYFNNKIRTIILKKQQDLELLSKEKEISNQFEYINNDILLSQILSRIYFQTLLLSDENIELLKFSQKEISNSPLASSLESFYKFEEATISEIWKEQFSKQFGDEMNPYFKESIRFYQSQQSYADPVEQVNIFNYKPSLSPENLEKIKKTLN